MSPIHHGDQILDFVPGKTLFDYADTLKIRVPTSCGRSGTCHECIIEIKRGMNGLCPQTESENFLQENYRLACQTKVINPDVEIEFGVLRRQPKILSHSIKRHVEIDPATVCEGDGVFFAGDRIDDYRGIIYGLAIDAGTTSVVINLVNLENGDVLQTSSFENPQRFGGSDIMHRISYDSGDFQGELQQVMLSAINFEIGEMSRQLNFHRRNIYEVVIVGNSTMRDIIFGINVQSIGEKPYKSLTELEMEQGIRKTTSLNVKAETLGLRVYPKANVYSGPLVGCHLGADVSADLLAIGIEEQDKTIMLVDVGTNTEVVIGNRDKMVATSCPAGPAFEGGAIKYGMPGYKGAIESIKLEGDKIIATTIGKSRPEGICGSGIVDLVAELRRSGRMNELGVLSDSASEFCFVPDLGMSLSRSDLSALAQAKSANHCGQFILLRHNGESTDKIDKLYLAGGFANYINIDNAVDIGFIANIPSERVIKAGNTSLEGATIMLVSREKREVIEKIVQRIEHVELETTPDFFDIFVEGCMFKPMNTPFI